MKTAKSKIMTLNGQRSQSVGLNAKTAPLNELLLSINIQNTLAVVVAEEPIGCVARRETQIKKHPPRRANFSFAEKSENGQTNRIIILNMPL